MSDTFDAGCGNELFANYLNAIYVRDNGQRVSEQLLNLCH